MGKGGQSFPFINTLTDLAKIVRNFHEKSFKKRPKMPTFLRYDERKK